MSRAILVATLLALVACSAEPPTAPVDDATTLALKKSKWETVSDITQWGLGMDDWSCLTAWQEYDGIRFRETADTGCDDQSKFNGKAPLEFEVRDDQNLPIATYPGEVNVIFKAERSCWDGTEWAGQKLFETESSVRLVGHALVEGVPTEVECYYHQWIDDGPTGEFTDDKWYYYSEIRLGDECRFSEWDAREDFFNPPTDGSC